ncbi:hypothetical protein [Streptomyces sp. OE57]|uniref:hypothetical protein n=1 Tax=Streptomyces lacaronensis TaxID=3379885 RepID=UPI0039B74742
MICNDIEYGEAAGCTCVSGSGWRRRWFFRGLEEEAHFRRLEESCLYAVAAPLVRELKYSGQLAISV